MEQTRTISPVIWHELVTDDIPRSSVFYTQLFGWRASPLALASGMEITVFCAEEQNIAGTEAADRGAAAHWLSYFAVKDVEAMAKTCRDAGAEILAPPQHIPNVGRFCSMQDPVGAAVALLECAERPDQPGENPFCWHELWAKDVDRAAAFYTAVMPWTATEVDLGSGAGKYVLFQEEGREVAGLSPLGGADRRSHWLPYIYVPDVHSLSDRARLLGATSLQDPVEIEGVGQLSVLHDPLGADFALLTPC